MNILTNNFLLPIYTAFNRVPDFRKGPTMPVRNSYYVRDQVADEELKQYDVVGQEVVEEEGGATKFKSHISLEAIKGPHVVGLCKNLTTNHTMHVFDKKDIDALKKADLLENFLQSKSRLREEDLYRVTEVLERADSIDLCVEKLNKEEEQMKMYIQSMSNYLVVTKGAIVGLGAGAGVGIGAALGAADPGGWTGVGALLGSKLAAASVGLDHGIAISGVNLGLVANVVSVVKASATIAGALAVAIAGAETVGAGVVGALNLIYI